jgi:hypothetical protein
MGIKGFTTENTEDAEIGENAPCEMLGAEAKPCARRMRRSLKFSCGVRRRSSRFTLITSHYGFGSGELHAESKNRTSKSR